MPSQPASNASQPANHADVNDAPAVPLTTLIAHLGTPPPPELTDLWCQQLAELEVTLHAHDWPICEMSLDDLWVTPAGQLHWPELSERISTSLAKQQFAAEHDNAQESSPHAPAQNSLQPLQQILKALGSTPLPNNACPNDAKDAPDAESLTANQRQTFPQLTNAPTNSANTDAPRSETKRATKHDKRATGQRTTETAHTEPGQTDSVKRAARHEMDPRYGIARRKRFGLIAGATIAIACLIGGAAQVFRKPTDPAQNAIGTAQSPLAKPDNVSAARTDSSFADQSTRRDASEAAADTEPLISLSPSRSPDVAPDMAGQTLESAADLQTNAPLADPTTLTPLDLPLPSFDWNAGAGASSPATAETPQSDGVSQVSTLPNTQPGDLAMSEAEPNIAPGDPPEFWKVDADHLDLMVAPTPAPADTPENPPIAASQVALRFNQRREQAILAPPQQTTAENWRWQVTASTTADAPPERPEDNDAELAEPRAKDDLPPLAMRWLITPANGQQRVDRGLLEIGHEGESSVRVRIRFDVRWRDAAEIRWLAAATLQPQLGYRPITHEQAGDWLATALAHRVRTLQMLQMTQVAYQNRANPEPVRDALRERRDQLEELADLADLWLERATELEELMRQIERELVIELAPSPTP